MINFNQIQQQYLKTEPFVWGIIPNLFSAENAIKLADTYPCDHYKLVTGYGGEKDYEYEARPLIKMGNRTIDFFADLSDVWQQLALDLLSLSYRNAMSRLTGIDLTQALLEVNVFHYGPGASLGAHCDLPEKIITHVLYFNAAWNVVDGGCLRVLNSNNIEDIVIEVPPYVGNSAVIVRAENSWHAVSRVVNAVQQSRRSVTVTFYRPGSSSSMWPADDTTELRSYNTGIV